jgi:hypothetical protein
MCRGLLYSGLYQYENNYVLLLCFDSSALLFHSFVFLILSHSPTSYYHILRPLCTVLKSHDVISLLRSFRSRQATVPVLTCEVEVKLNIETVFGPLVLEVPLLIHIDLKKPSLRICSES